MPGNHPEYPPEFRRQIIELARAGRSPTELAREFAPTYETIRQWVRQADRDQKTELVLEALNMAIWQRVIHHSDQGSQYTSIAFGRRCREAEVRPSMGSIGDCSDHAMCESFFATLECELLKRCSFTTRPQARMALFEFIEG